MNAWLARNLVYRPATWLRGERVFGLLRRYEASQWWSEAELRRLQEDALGRILRHALRHSRHYAALGREAGLDAERADAGDLTRLPLLTKPDLVEHAAAIDVARWPGTYSWKTTGGSLGVPVRLKKDRSATAAEQAASWRSYGWYGVRPGDRQARFWGTALGARARLRFRAIDWVLNRDRFSAFAFSREDLRGYYRRLVESRPAWAYGYVSMLVQFADFCREEKLPLEALGVGAVVTTSEVLAPGDRERICAAFGAPVYNEYGCGEVGAILYECERGTLHLMAENLWVELIPDPTESRPDAHRLVLTDLHNRATPLLRYDVGDRVVPAAGCACGRGLPAFREVFGRAYDFVEAADGRRFHGEFFLYHLEEARDAGMPILQAQFVQERPDRLRVRIVPGPGYREEDGATLARRLARESGERFEVATETVGGLEREASGKLRLIRALPAPRGGPSVGRTPQDRAERGAG